MTMTDMIKNNEKAPKTLGLYIHIPFCRSKCLYCDFCSFVGKNEDERELYVDALCREIEQRGTDGYLVDTVYFGGGTPSILLPYQIDRILLAIKRNFKLSLCAEITLECNPITHLDDGKEYFKALKEIGINRLSIGVQSANDDELKLIGRRHSFEQAKRAFFDAQEVGFDNISLDLMLGIPSQTLESLKESVNELITLSPEHISIYSLQLEEGTPLYRMRDRYAMADEDTAADMYELVVSLMKESGYLHYEISNFAKEGKESKHNSKYWRLDEYLGLGLAAHSDFSGKRMENTKNIDEYLLGNYLANEQMIEKSEREFEFLMLGLRTSAGVSRNEYSARFGASFDEKYASKMQKFIDRGYIYANEDRVCLGERGFEVSNTILAELLDFDF